ncbi:hypothetical protein OPQ81_008704 [Rhizoctonia solani]|nr:hypothetical protein OPQ81_008704 [Rhizoctonia solani]
MDGARPDHLRFYPYVRHFTHNGKRVKIQYRSQVPDRAVFGAMALPEEGEPYPIMVKFAESYHVTAHRMLAAKGLAPELLFASSEDPKESGFAKRIMVVMRRVTGSDLATTSPVPQRVLDDISSALKILHDSNLVYGDLRPPNVLAVEDQCGKITGGMLIDFDWCGTAGQAKYPWNINPVVQWPKGVTPGAIISMEHDLAMLKGLSKRVERS